MAMSVGTAASNAPSSEPNVVPMIDIMLVLLIIFMISQPLSRQSLTIQVPPDEQAAATTQPSTQIVLELTGASGFAINGQPVPKDQLAQQIHTIFDPRPNKLLFIKSAPTRRYQEVIEAMDIAKGAGIQIIGFTPAEAGTRPAAAQQQQ